MIVNYLVKLAKDIHKCYKVRIVCSEENTDYTESLVTKEKLVASSNNANSLLISIILNYF